MRIFTGTSYKDAPTAELVPYHVNSFQQFCELYIKGYAREGPKNQHYITIGNNYLITPGDKTKNKRSYLYKDHYHRNDESQLSAWLLPFDGDCCAYFTDSCIPPEMAHYTLSYYNLNHVIYTTHSHIPGLKNRWRAFLPCIMSDKSQLAPTIEVLLRTLQTGNPEIRLSNESKTWALPWYLPTTNDINRFRFYSFYKGYDFRAEDPVTSVHVAAAMGESKTYEQMIEIIRTGASPLHENMRNYIYGAIKDRLAPAVVKTNLKAFTAGWDLSDKRLADRRADIDRLVDLTDKKYNAAIIDDVVIDDDNSRIYTKYPTQGKVFEAMVQVCMQWMIFPNRQIAITAINTLISLLMGRVITLPDGSGVVFTALVTGRTGSGKGQIKGFINFVLNNFMEKDVAGELLGGHYFTSPKNLINGLKKYGTLLSIRTESGQTDQSKAGDMSRVKLYELELATHHGEAGYISSGDQNEKVPHMYSPAMTTVRESVAEIQSQADILNQASVSGIAGRRSHIIIDPIKTYRNKNRLTVLPDWFKDTVKKMYDLTMDSRRHDIERKMPPEVWHRPVYADKLYFDKKSDEWVDQENEAKSKGNLIEIAFWSRLHERVPAWAARNAVLENINNTIITNELIDIAEESLKSELYAQIENPVYTSWDMFINDVATFFKGKMIDNPRLLKHERKDLLKKGACSWSTIRKLIRHKDHYKELSAKNGFHKERDERLKDVNIFRMSDKESLKYSRINPRIIYCKNWK